MQWKTWLMGIGSAFIGSAANSVTLIILDPLTFNLQEGLKRVLTVAVVSGILAVAFYLKESPLPKSKK